MTLTNLTPDSVLDRQTIRDFLDGHREFYSLPEPQWGPIGQEVFERTYARTIEVTSRSGESLGTRRESWAETVRRVVLGSLSYIPRELWREDEDVELFDLLYNFRAMPAGRHLWVTGTNASTFSKNCWSASFGQRTSSHFAFLASRLLEGGGVGSNYSRDLLVQTEPIVGALRLHFRLNEDHPDFGRVSGVAAGLVNEYATSDEVIVVEDSREGWVDVWTRVINIACDRPGENHVVVDLSQVRPYGAPLKTFGGTASGPDALVRSLLGVAKIVNGIVDSTLVGRHLTGLEAMQIDHELAAAVVAGGSRRSARMSIMHWRDPDVFNFIHVKEDFSSHWTTNISVEIDEEFHEALGDARHPQHGHAEKVLDEVTRGMVLNGEPGMLDLGLASRDERSRIRVTNPCVTGDSWVQTSDGLRQVRDLVGKGTIDLVVNDQVWPTGPQGFFKTGDKATISINVDGTSLRVTPDHLISTPEGWRPAGDLEVGDSVNLTDSVGNSWGGRGTREEGYLIGHLIGDGYINVPNRNGAPGSAVLCAWYSDEGSEDVKQHILSCIKSAGLQHRSDWGGWRDHGDDKQELQSAAIRDLAASFGVVKGGKTISPDIMEASSDFVIGLLQGLFDTDGHVEGDSTRGGLSVRLSQSNYEMLSQVRVLLLALGIKSSVRMIHEERMKVLPGGSYQTKACYRLIVSGRHAETFSKVVGFINTAKLSKLTTRMATMTRGFYEKPMVGTVLSVSKGEVEPVFDCQVPGLNAFVANGTIVHNCGEALLESHDVEGLIAGESCNLGSVDLDSFGTDREGALRAFELMARFLYRATLNPHDDRWASHIENVNRRLGVGLMGLQGWCAAHGVRLGDLENATELHDDLTAFRQAARRAADELAERLGTPRSIKVTAVAPTGTIAQLRGTQPGIHPVFARYFIRRVRYANADPGLEVLRSQGYPVVDDVYAANTSVVEFVVADSILQRFDESLIEQSDELDADTFLGVIATVQRTFCGEGDGQSVSATAQIPAGSSPTDLAAVIRRRLGTLKGFTVFPEVSRPLSPYQSITREEYDIAVESGLALSVGDSNSGECVGGACPVR